MTFIWSHPQPVYTVNSNRYFFSFEIAIRDIVSAYLQDDKVVTRNTQEETFETSMRVFVDQLQTRIEPAVVQTSSQVVFDVCQQRFEDLLQRYNHWKQTRGTTSR